MGCWPGTTRITSESTMKIKIPISGHYYYDNIAKMAGSSHKHLLSTLCACAVKPAAVSATRCRSNSEREERRMVRPGTREERKSVSPLPLLGPLSLREVSHSPPLELPTTPHDLVKKRGAEITEEIRGYGCALPVVT